MFTIVFFGKCSPFEELPALLTGADLFVFLSLLEGFGLPPLEAMACGAPVIAARATSLPEVVGDAGVLVDPHRVEEIAATRHRVLTHDPFRATLREKGLARVKQFTWERTTRLTHAAYREAWERWPRNGCGEESKLHNTPYRAFLHDHVLQTSIQYNLTEDTAAPPWPI